MSAELDIIGLGPLLASLDQFPAIVGPELERATRAGLLLAVADLKQYPAPPAGSRYIRTNNLARGWSEGVPDITTAGGDFEATLVNTLARSRNGLSYGPYVQDRAEQSPVHLGRWTTVQDVLAARGADIESYYEAAARRIARTIEGGS